MVLYRVVRVQMVKMANNGKNGQQCLQKWWLRQYFFFF
jgi:hypothetical protein